jgi:choline-sulfatase
VSGPPNLLLVMADQMSAPFIPPWGGPAITPAIDRLAADGVVFDTTYSNSPLCAPARFVMMSGRHASRIGAYDNAAEFAASIPTFAHHLRAVGYQTCLAGKMHFVGPDQLHGFEERLTTDIYPADFGWTPDWRDPDGRFDWWYHNLDSVTGAGTAEVSNQLDFDDEVGFRAVRKLRDLARTADERPWMLTVSFTHPHDPYVARRELWDLYDHDAIPLPTVADGAAPDDPHSRRLRRVFGGDVTELTDDDIRNARHAYFANCSYVDRWTNELLRTLDVFDMARNTIVIFTADHGDMLGERGLWYKMSFFEASARIPLIVHAPDRYAPRRVATPTSLLDIAPTLIDLAGAEVPPEMDGHSLVPQLDGDEDPERIVEGEFMGEGAIAPIVMLRRGASKFVTSEPDGDQLFDLEADPHELNNLADDADPDDLEWWRSAVAERWDLARIRDDVLASQAARRVVHAAMQVGRRRPWDFEPRTDASNQYMRNHLDLNDVERGRRAPR